MNDTDIRSPHHVDRHVGALIRMKRRALGVTQTELAVALGVTFQQVQKYERGANRVSASKLFEIAQKLDTPLAAFFEGLEAPRQVGDVDPTEMLSFLGERGSRELIVAFTELRPALRARLVSLAEAMANASE